MTDRGALRLSAEITPTSGPADVPVEVKEEVEKKMEVEVEVDGPLKGLEQQRRDGPALLHDGEGKEQCEIEEGEGGEGGEEHSGGESVLCRDIETPLDTEQTGGTEGRGEGLQAEERDSLLDLLVACATKLGSVSDQSKSSQVHC